MNFKLKKLISCLILVLIAISGIFGLEKNKKTNSGKQLKSKGISMAAYSMKYADYQHRSFINSPIAIQGKVSCIDKVSPYETWPLLILSSDNNIYVQYNDNVKCLTEDGKLVLEMETAPGFDIVLTPKSILARESGGSLTGYSTNGKELFTRRIYTGTYPAFILMAYTVGEQITLAQTFLRRPKMPGQKGSSSNSTLLLMKGEELGWVQECSGRMPTALLTEDYKSVIWVKPPYSCCTYEITTGVLQNSFDLKNRVIVAMSLDREGDIIAACVSNTGKSSLLCCKLDGSVQWNYEFEYQQWSDNPIPPVVDNQNRIWVIVGTTLFLVVNGEAKEITSVPGIDAQYMTAFNNDRVVVAADSMVKIVDSQGEEIFQGVIPMKITITTPPVVGSSGALYLGTEAGVYQFK